MLINYHIHLIPRNEVPRRYSEVHPEMKIVIIYSPWSCSKPVWISFFCWKQNNIFCIQTVFGPHWLSYYGDQQLFGYPHSSKYIFMFNRRNSYMSVSQSVSQYFYSSIYLSNLKSSCGFLWGTLVESHCFKYSRHWTLYFIVVFVLH